MRIKESARYFKVFVERIRHSKVFCLSSLELDALLDFVRWMQRFLYLAHMNIRKIWRLCDAPWLGYSATVPPYGVEVLEKSPASKWLKAVTTHTAREQDRKSSSRRHSEVMRPHAVRTPIAYRLTRMTAIRIGWPVTAHGRMQPDDQ